MSCESESVTDVFASQITDLIRKEMKKQLKQAEKKLREEAETHYEQLREEQRIANAFLWDAIQSSKQEQTEVVTAVEDRLNMRIQETEERILVQEEPVKERVKKSKKQNLRVLDNFYEYEEKDHYPPSEVRDMDSATLKHAVMRLLLNGSEKMPYACKCGANNYSEFAAGFRRQAEKSSGLSSTMRLLRSCEVCLEITRQRDKANNAYYPKMKKILRNSDLSEEEKIQYIAELKELRDSRLMEIGFGVGNPNKYK